MPGGCGGSKYSGGYNPPNPPNNKKLIRNNKNIAKRIWELLSNYNKKTFRKFGTFGKLD
ncbi:MAG: hypothetical protein QG635_525 [Bacteroidota bacterium]|nr:hypothetical protein [Bacteroidota bacterium]